MSEEEKAILDSAHNRPHEIIQLDRPKASKLKVLNRLLKKAENEQRYEDCQVLSDVILILNVAT